MAAPVSDAVLGGQQGAGHVDERRELLFQLAHRVASLFQTRQVRELDYMLGKYPANRIGLGFGHGHGEELPKELRLAPEVEKVLDTPLTAVEVDLSREKLGVDLVFGKLALPIRLAEEVLEIAGMAGTHFVQPVQHVLIAVEATALVESLQSRRGNVVEFEAGRGPECEEATIEFALTAFSARHHDLSGHKAP